MGLLSAWERQWKGKRAAGGREKNPVQLQSDKQSRGEINMKIALEKRETEEEKKDLIRNCI